MLCLQVKKVLLLGQKEYIEKEWKDIDEFQDVYFMEVSGVVSGRVGSVESGRVGGGIVLLVSRIRSDLHKSEVVVTNSSPSGISYKERRRHLGRSTELSDVSHSLFSSSEQGNRS